MCGVVVSDDGRCKMFSFLKTQTGIYVEDGHKCRRFVEGVLWMARSGA
jgi:hypothetical protein